MKLYVAISAAILVMLCGPSAQAEPMVPGFNVEVYAAVTDPTTLTFDPNGVLYAGRDNRGSGGRGMDSVKIHQIGVGGSSVATYGASAIADPDAVAFDKDGKVSGTPGAVLVGINQNNQGLIKAILPDQSIITVLGPTSVAFTNIATMKFDPTGRYLLMTDLGVESQIVVLDTEGIAGPTTLASLPSRPYGIAINEAGQIFTSTEDGRILVYNADGTLVTDNFASGLVFAMPLAFGPGGVWGSYLYGVSGGKLLRFDEFGFSSIVGTGFDINTYDIMFGPDKALYAANFDSDQIIRIFADVPVPSTLVALVGMAGVWMLARAWRRGRRSSALAA